MRESDIVYERGEYWVGRRRTHYSVFKNGVTSAVEQGRYRPDADGLSIATAQVNYLARRAAERAAFDAETEAGWPA